MTILNSWAVSRVVDGATIVQKVDIEQTSGYRLVWVTSGYAGKQTRYYVGRALSDDSLQLILRLTGLAA